MSEDSRKAYREMFASSDARSIAVATQASTQESARVAFMLKRFELAWALPALKRRAQEFTGNNSLTFAVFNDIFPEFPFRLGYHTLRGLTVPYEPRVTAADYDVHRDPFSGEGQRHRKYTWVPYVIAFEQFYEAVVNPSDLRYIGLVFPRKGFAHGMVIYADAPEHYWPFGLGEVFKYARNNIEHRLIRRPFASLVDAIHSSSGSWKAPSQR